MAVEGGSSPCVLVQDEQVAKELQYGWLVTDRKERESRLPGCRFQNGTIGRLRWVAFGATV